MGFLLLSTSSQVSTVWSLRVGGGGSQRLLPSGAEKHRKGVSTADTAPACPARLGCPVRRGGTGDSLVITVLFLSHPGVNLFFQFWHWERKERINGPGLEGSG